MGTLDIVADTASRDSVTDDLEDEEVTHLVGHNLRAYIEDLEKRMRELGRFESVGEVRCAGLMAAIELVADRETRRGFPVPHSAATFVVSSSTVSCRKS